MIFNFEDKIERQGINIAVAKKPFPISVKKEKKVKVGGIFLVKSKNVTLIVVCFGIFRINLNRFIIIFQSSVDHI